MKIGDTIRARRRALGLTQEALAGKLGVSAPAVNKWERALNYPDITLLPVLARILGVDLNTLLCFREDMSREEVGLFLNELLETAKAEGAAAAFQLAGNKLREFPNDDLLAVSIAGLLEGVLAMYPEGGGEEREAWEGEIAALYERAAQSTDPRVREQAVCVIAARCAGRGELERAEALLEQLPDGHRQKRTLAAALRRKQGRYEEAWVLLEEELLGGANAVQNTLLHMVNLAVAEGDQNRAGTLAELASAAAGNLGLPDCVALSASLQLALAEKDGPRALVLLEEVLESLTAPWDWRASPLYRHLPGKEGAGESQRALLRPLLDQLEADPESQFLKDVPGYAALAERYRKYSD